MINVNRLDFIKEKIDFLARQLDLVINWLPNSELSTVGSESKKKELALMVKIIGNTKDYISKIYDEVSIFDTKAKLSATPPDVQLEKMIKIDNLLKKSVKLIASYAYKHDAAKLDPFVREIKKATEDLYEEFDIVIPSIRSEIEKITGHFRLPAHAKKSIIPELTEITTFLERKQISLEDYLNGFTLNKKEFRGYNELRTVDNVFSPYQNYENLPNAYDAINGHIYGIAKALEVFIMEKKGDPEFMDITKRYEELNKGAGSKKSKITAASMSEVFEVYQVFNQILKKMRIKYSFKDEFKKSESIFKEFIDDQKKLVVYNMSVFNKTKELVLNNIKDEGAKVKALSIVEQVELEMNEKRIPFQKIESVFKQLIKGDMHIVVVEKEAEDLTIQITPSLSDKYGEDILLRTNLTIDEVQFWFPEKSRLEKFDDIAPFTKAIQDGATVDKAALFDVLNKLDDEIETTYRKHYDSTVKNLAQISIGMEKILTSRAEQEKLDKELMEKDSADHYKPTLSKAKKALLVVINLMRDQTGGNDKSNKNKFPFIKLASNELGFIFYELIMRIFTLLPNVDKRSTANMINILSIYREHHDISALWKSLMLVRKPRNIINFEVMESQIKMMNHNKEVQEEIAKTLSK